MRIAGWVTNGASFVSMDFNCSTYIGEGCLLEYWQVSPIKRLLSMVKLEIKREWCKDNVFLRIAQARGPRADWWVICVFRCRKYLYLIIIHELTLDRSSLRQISYSTNNNYVMKCHSKLDAPWAYSGVPVVLVTQIQKAMRWAALNCSVPVIFFKWGVIKTIWGVTEKSCQQRPFGLPV